MQWTITDIVPAQITLSCTGYGPLIGDGHNLNAEIVQTGESATATVVNGSDIFLTFVSVPLTPFTLRVGQNDPAVRNSSGGFLQSADMAGNAPAGQPASEEIFADGNLSAVVSYNSTQEMLTMQIPVGTPENAEFWVANLNLVATTRVENPPGTQVAMVPVNTEYAIKFINGGWAAVLQIPN
jgi:hypothetical protein